MGCLEAEIQSIRLYFYGSFHTTCFTHLYIYMCVCVFRYIYSTFIFYFFSIKLMYNQKHSTNCYFAFAAKLYVCLEVLLLCDETTVYRVYRGALERSTLPGWVRQFTTFTGSAWTHHRLRLGQTLRELNQLSRRCCSARHTQIKTNILYRVCACKDCIKHSYVVGFLLMLQSWYTRSKYVYIVLSFTCYFVWVT